MGIKGLVNIDYLRSLIRALTPYIFTPSNHRSSKEQALLKTT
jgi:hypothetical protein